MSQTLFNYSYSRQASKWFLKRKLKDIYTMNSFHLLEKNIPSQSQHEPNFDIQEEKFVIRPPNQRYPQAIEKYVPRHRIITVLLPGDRFPDVIVGKCLFSESFKSYNLGNNGKFTFVVQWNYNSQQSRRAFHRFHQLFKHRWSRYIPNMEFYGLCKGSWEKEQFLEQEAGDDKESFEKEARKRKWEFCTHFYCKNDRIEENEYYLPHQVFNCCLTDDLQGIFGEEEDIFIIINPKGIVMRAEKPSFCSQPKDKGI